MIQLSPQVAHEVLLIRTSVGLLDVGDAYVDMQKDPVIFTLEAPDGTQSNIVTTRARAVPMLYEVQIGYRTIVDAGDRLVLSSRGWCRLDSLAPGDMAVVRCGGKQQAPYLENMQLSPKLHLRMVEKITPHHASPGASFVVYDFVCDDGGKGYETDGVIVRTAAQKEA